MGKCDAIGKVGPHSTLSSLYGFYTHLFRLDKNLWRSPVSPTAREMTPPQDQPQIVSIGMSLRGI
jgi:hypothetical protein